MFESFKLIRVNVLEIRNKIQYNWIFKAWLFSKGIKVRRVVYYV